MQNTTRTLILAASLAVCGASAYAAEQLGHFVDYQVDVRNLPPGASGDGTWQMGLVGLCKSWKVSQIADLHIRAGEKQVSLALTQQAEEGGDGLSGNYNTQISANGQQAVIQAAVTFPGRDGAGKMNTTVGSASATKDIPAGTLLLAMASQAMLDRLAAGQTDFSLRAIEPTAPDGTAELHVQVLADSPFAATPLPADTNGALKGKSWFIRLTKKQGNGAQDTLLQLYESGVVARIIADISGIRFEMTARNINVFPKPAC